MNDMNPLNKSALYRKAKEISNLALNLVDALPDQAPNASLKDSDVKKFNGPVSEITGDMAQKMWEEHKKWITECALIIPAKIAGAEGADMYDIYYENAALVRKACRELTVNMSGLHLCGYKEDDYLNLVRNGVEIEFKPLFREWVSTFNDKEFIPDSWGLFNPPGVNWNDVWCKKRCGS